MSNVFDIPVLYKEQELHFQGELITIGFTHKIKIQLDATSSVFFEPDEERNYRAVMDNTEMDKIAAMDIELLKAIASAIEHMAR